MQIQSLKTEALVNSSSIWVFKVEFALLQLLHHIRCISFNLEILTAKLLSQPVIKIKVLPFASKTHTSSLPIIFYAKSNTYIPLNTIFLIFTSSNDSRSNEILKVAHNKLTCRLHNKDEAQTHIQLTLEQCGGQTHLTSLLHTVEITCITFDLP